MTKRSRERHLAKLSARRQAERQASKRRRDLIVGIVGGLLAIGLLVVLGNMFLGGDESTPAASGPTGVSGPSGPSGPSGASGSPTDQAKPGTQTGTVDPTSAGDSVACGGTKPPNADDPKPQFAGPPPMKVDPKATYTATMVTSCGTIVFELDPKAAPQTVNSFVFLANKGYFDGQYIHRIDTSIDVLQGGDPTGTGSGGPGYAIPDELGGQMSYVPGTLAMANAGPGTGGSQFFIITGPNGAQLDAVPNYSIFGQVTEGLDVAEQIQQLPVTDPSAGIEGQRPTDAIYIESVSIEKS